MRRFTEMLLAIALFFVAGGAASAESFLETGLPVFTNDSAAQRIYRLPSLVAYEPEGPRKGIALARFNLDWLMETECESE